jgi:tripartite-type tricarboxylate transporter receptor subunit TctC
MKQTAKLLSGTLAGLLVAGLVSGSVAAQSMESFYKGKTVKVIVGFSSGGGYSKYCFQLLRALPQYVPGNPTMVCQFMKGGGGVKAANYMYNAGPKDGSVIGMLSDYMSVAQLLRPKKIRYDARKFTYLGVMVPANPVLMAWHTAPVQSLKDLQKQELIVGLTGKLSAGGINSAIMNKFIGTSIKFVLGYGGTSKIALAMENGEVQGSMSSWVSWKSRAQAWIKDKKITPIIQVGLQKAKDLPNVPLLLDYAKSDADRQVLALISGGGPFGRSIIAPPGMAKYQIDGWRAAFDKAMADTAFLAEAKRRSIEIDPSSGADVQPIVDRILSTPKDVVKRAQKAVGIK